MEKKQKQEEKEKRAEERKRKKDIKMTAKRPVKKKRNSYSESSSDDNEEWEESVDSMDDVESEGEKGDFECEKENNAKSDERKLSFNDIQIGDYVLAKFF